jgi:hypothetical protein
VGLLVSILPYSRPLSWTCGLLSCTALLCRYDSWRVPVVVCRADWYRKWLLLPGCFKHQALLHTLCPPPPPCSSHSRLASEAGGSAYPWARLRLPLSPLNWATAAARMDLRVEEAAQLT